MKEMWADSFLLEVEDNLNLILLTFHWTESAWRGYIELQGKWET